MFFIVSRQVVFIQFCPKLAFLSKARYIMIAITTQTHDVHLT